MFDACQGVVLPTSADVDQVWPLAAWELLHGRLSSLLSMPCSLSCSLSVHSWGALCSTGLAANLATSPCTLQMCGQRE